MAQVRVVTDSTSCIPGELAKELNITVAPVSMTINGRVYLDEVDITLDKFWEMLPKLEKLPITSGVGPGEFVTAFTGLAEGAPEIMVIPMSSGIGVSVSSATQAREQMKQTYPGLRIDILDSRASSGALGFIVIEAARAAKAGKSIAEVRQVAEDLRRRVNHFTGIHSLKYLSSVGRIPESMASSGAADNSSLQLKTIIHVNTATGKIELVGKYRGTINAMKDMIVRAKEWIGDREAHFNVHYNVDIREADALKKMVIDNFRIKELLVTPFTAVMVCSTGPQFGMAFWA